MKETIKLYGSSGCPTCIGVKKYLEQRDVPFEYIDVRKDPEGMQMLDDLNIHTIPVLMYKDKLITGFNPIQLNEILLEVDADGNA